MDANLIYGTANEINREQFKLLGIASYGAYGSSLAQEAWIKMRENINSDTTWDSILSTSKGFVCADGERIVGMAFLVPHGNPWYAFKTEWSYIRMVGVHPDYQGRGIAKTLTENCIAYAKATNEKTIALHTSELMHAARHIYESLGFTILEELPIRFGIKYWLYTLELK